MNELEGSLQQRALKKVRQAWSGAAAHRYTDLETINRYLPEDRRYRSQDELIRRSAEQANAITDFAVDLGLVTRGERTDLREQARKQHPEIDTWGLWEVCPSCGGFLEAVGMFSGQRPDNNERGGGAHYKCERCSREYFWWFSGGPLLITGPEDAT